MIDWRSLPAGRELDIYVAKRRGWHSYYLDKDERDETGYEDGWYLVDEDDNKIHPDAYIGEEDVWEADELPAVSTDANAALALFAAEDGAPIPCLRQQIVGTGWCAAIFKSTNVSGDVWTMHPGTYIQADTPALALVRAWFISRDLIDGK